MGLRNSKPLYYYPHFCYVYLRYLTEYIKPLSNTNDINEVFTNIYIGNLSTAYNKDKLNELGIKNVVTAISGMSPIYPKEFNYIVVDLLDIKSQNIMSIFDSTNLFIDNALSKGEKVYVHCMCGVSRSVSIVCAYLAYKHNIEPLEALKMIKNIRNVANPNPSFLQQLENYYLSLENLPENEKIDKINQVLNEQIIQAQSIPDDNKSIPNDNKSIPEQHNITEYLT
jgi:hypothetical protein